jgi:hypothetical protein
MGFEIVTFIYVKAVSCIRQFVIGKFLLEIIAVGLQLKNAILIGHFLLLR